MTDYLQTKQHDYTDSKLSGLYKVHIDSFLHHTAHLPGKTHPRVYLKVHARKFRFGPFEASALHEQILSP